MTYGAQPLLAYFIFFQGGHTTQYQPSDDDCSVSCWGEGGI